MGQESDRQFEPRPLLILDLDETLIHGSLHELGRPADMHVGPYHVYFRAGLLEFLARASAQYRLAVWSSASSAYVEQISKRILADLPEPEFVWSRERCTRRIDFNLQEEYFAKDLAKVRRYGFDLKRTLILEDEPRKVAKHFGNAIYVRPFLGLNDDGELLDLAAFVEQIAGEANFRSVEKRNWRPLHS